jgi:hypothetical protein
MQGQSANDAEPGESRAMLTALQARFEHYRRLAAQAPPTTTTTTTTTTAAPAPAAAAASAADAQAMLQMTRREIEVLAVYHSELHRLVTEQDAAVDRMHAELGETRLLADRLQQEVEKKVGGAVSPRRQARQQLRAQIADTRQRIDACNSELAFMQRDLDAVRAEHADVRAFVSRQFFPVSRIPVENKVAVPATAAGSGSRNTVASAMLSDASLLAATGDAAAQHPPRGTQQSAQKQTFLHNGREFLVRPTRTAAIRQALVEDRRRGFVPGTNVRSTTHGITQSLRASARSGSRGGSPGSAGHTAGDSPTGSRAVPADASAQRAAEREKAARAAYRASAAKLRGIRSGLAPDQFGHIRFTRRAIDGSARRRAAPATPATIAASFVAGSLARMTGAALHGPAAAPAAQPSSAASSVAGGGFSGRGERGLRAASLDRASAAAASDAPVSIRSPSTLSQERHVRARGDQRVPFRSIALYATSPTQGIARHVDPAAFSG